jgi:hypothetical protein
MIFLINIVIYLSLGLKREHRALQKRKFINFFLFLDVDVANPDPIRSRNIDNKRQLTRHDCLPILPSDGYK